MTKTICFESEHAATIVAEVGSDESWKIISTIPAAVFLTEMDRERLRQDAKSFAALSRSAP